MIELNLGGEKGQRFLIEARLCPDDANQAMVARLRSIAQDDLAPTDYEVNFYTHELREFDRYTNLGWTCTGSLQASTQHTSFRAMPILPRSRPVS